MKTIFDLNSDLLNRFRTLIETIKTSNNTFYDAYNNFQEQLFKSLCNKENLVYPKGSITVLLDNKAIKYYLINEMKLNEKLLDKIKDCALKINKHKHVNEKKLDIDNAISYMTCLFEIIDEINKYYSFKLWNVKVSSYILKIYGQKEDIKVDVVPLVIENKQEDDSNNGENKAESRDLNQVNLNKIRTGNTGKERTRLVSLLSDKVFISLKYIVLVSTIIMLVSNVCMYIFFAELSVVLAILNVVISMPANIYFIYSLIRMIRQKESFNIKDAKFLPVDYTSLEVEPLVATSILFLITEFIFLGQAVFYILSIFSFVPKMIVFSILYIISTAVSVLLLRHFFKSYFLRY